MLWHRASSDDVPVFCPLCPVHKIYPWQTQVVFRIVPHTKEETYFRSSIVATYAPNSRDRPVQHTSVNSQWLHSMQLTASWQIWSQCSFFWIFHKEHRRTFKGVFSRTVRIDQTGRLYSRDFFGSPNLTARTMIKATIMTAKKATRRRSPRSKLVRRRYHDNPGPRG